MKKTFLGHLYIKDETTNFEDTFKNNGSRGEHTDKPTPNSIDINIAEKIVILQKHSWAPTLKVKEKIENSLQNNVCILEKTDKQTNLHWILSI